MSSSDHYDVIIIGAGQAGGPFAGAAASSGRRTAIVERAHVGGTCINEGCTPTKTMVASARAADSARRAEEYGVRAGQVSVDMARVRARKARVVEEFRTNSERSLATAGVELIRTSACFTGARRIALRADGIARTITGDVVVINTGLRPGMPRIPGLDSVPYLTSTSIMELDVVPEHLLILGGGYVGVEFAQMFRRFGSRVTIVQHGPQLLPREDEDVAGAITAIFREDGIDVLLGSEVTSVERAGDAIVASYRSGTASMRTAASDLRGSHLLVATGRVPNTEDLGLADAGVQIDQRGFIPVNERLETSAPMTYAVGDVTGGPAFTHISYDDFRILRANVLEGRSATTTGRVVPYTVFTDPQLGRIGMTEWEARKAGRHIRVARLPMSRVARAIESAETRGVTKAIIDADSGRILGASVLGMEGGEIAAMLQVAMMGDLPYTALRDGIFSHPTLAESLNNLFMAMEKNE